MDTHPCGERSDAAQDQPGIERGGHAADDGSGMLRGGEALIAPAKGERSAVHVAVTPQILGGGVHHHIGP